MGRGDAEVPSDLLMRRSGSLKGRTRRGSKDHGGNQRERRKHRKEKESSTESPKGSPSKRKAKEKNEVYGDKIPATNLDSTGKPCFNRFMSNF